MTFEQAKYFCTIADERSINKAARLLNVSQPRLSHSMQTMEAELGFQIFYRSSIDFCSIRKTTTASGLYRERSLL